MREIRCLCTVYSFYWENQWEQLQREPVQSFQAFDPATIIKHEGASVRCFSDIQKLCDSSDKETDKLQ